jgi:RHS repeat-associated protein
VKAIRQPGALRSIRRIALRRSPVSFEHCDATGSWTTSDNLRDGFPTICKRSYPGTGEVSLAFQRASKRVQQGAPEIPLLPLTAGTTAMYTATGAAPQYILHSDWLGSSRLGYNSSNSGSGKLDGDQAYGPFGESYNVNGSSLNVFTGQTADMGIGAGSSPIYDFLFRQYSATQGRWMVPDPAGMAAVNVTNPQTWNRYAYVANNPLNATDPLGLYCAVNPHTGGTLNGCTQGAGGFWWGPGEFDVMTLPVSIDGNGMAPASVASSITYDPNQIGFPDDPAETINTSMVGLNYLPGTYSIGMFALGNSSAYLTTGGGTGGGGGLLSSILHKPWVVSWIIPIAPVPVLAGIGPAGDLEFNPDTHTACIGIGIGASAGKNIAGGPLTNGQMFNGQNYPNGADNILGGWSVSGGYNTPALVGVQGMINGSGMAGGPTVGLPGVSIASTNSYCTKLW